MLKIGRRSDNPVLAALAESLGGVKPVRDFRKDGRGDSGEQISPANGWACVSPAKVVEFVGEKGLKLVGLEVVPGRTRGDDEYVALIQHFSDEGDELKLKPDETANIDRLNRVPVSFLHVWDYRETSTGTVVFNFVGQPRPHGSATAVLPKKAKVLFNGKASDE